MSNYATLKAAIQAAVYTNGSGLITGSALQTVLLDIVNTVGGGYTFAGVATGGTSPGTPDQNVYYIAPAGTYTNFGSSYTVPVGSIGVFTYNGSWSKSSLGIITDSMTDGEKATIIENLGLGDGTIDSKPTGSSKNLITSGGVRLDDVLPLAMLGSPIYFEVGAASVFAEVTYNATTLISEIMRTADCLIAPKKNYQINVLYSDDLESRASSSGWITTAHLIDTTYEFCRIVFAKTSWGSISVEEKSNLVVKNIVNEIDLNENTFPHNLTFYQGSVADFGLDPNGVNNIIISDIFLTDKINGMVVSLDAHYMVNCMYSDDAVTKAGTSESWVAYKVFSSQYKYCRLLISRKDWTSLTPSDNYALSIMPASDAILKGYSDSVVFSQGSFATFDANANGISSIISSKPLTNTELFEKYIVVPNGYQCHVDYSNDMSGTDLKSGWQTELYKIDDSYSYYRIRIAKTNWGNITPSEALSTWFKYLPYKQLYEQHIKKDYVVKKSGGADYTSLAQCIEDNYGKKDVVIRLEAGIYDIIDELEAIHEESWWDAINGNIGNRGIELGDNITIIGTPNAVIQGNYTGNKSNVKSGFSVFNAGGDGGFTLIGVNIEASNIRYCVHDERGAQPVAYTNTYKGCDFYLDNSANDAWASKQCIGGGLGVNGNIYIEDCKFETVTDDVYYPVSYHNSSSAAACSRIVCRGNYFADNQSFRFSWYGTSTLMTDILASNNNLGAAILTRRENADYDVVNIRLHEWNNIIRGA